MKKILFLILLIFIGCSKPEHSIELYLLKSRAKNKVGISQDEFLKKAQAERREVIEIGKYSTFDTINNKIIFAGEFDIYECELENKPFILNEEIEYLDLNTDKIKFTESAKTRISSLPGYMREGIQFVITDNRIPVFGGYFYSTLSSFGSDWNSISYVHKIEDYEAKEKYNNIIYKGNGMGYWLENHVDFNKYPKFIRALEESNKLKKASR